MCICKKILLIGCSLLMIAFVLVTHGQSSRSSVLHTMMLTAGVETQEGSLSAWAQLPSEVYTEEKAMRIAEGVFKELDIPFDYAKSSWSEDRRQATLQVLAVTPMRAAMVIVQELRGLETGSTEVHMVVDIQMKAGELMTLPERERRLETYMQIIGKNPHISTCLAGWQDGKLMDGQWDERMLNALQVISATPSAPMLGNGFIGFSGYTPAIADYLAVDSNRINVHMVARYSPYDNRTYLVAGSPIINREY